MHGDMLANNGTAKSLTNYKRIGRDTILKVPALKERNEGSLGVYYAISQSEPLAVKCFSRKTFRATASLDNSFLILAGRSARVIRTPKHHYYLSSYCNSGTLNDFLKKGVRLDEIQIITLLLQLSQQLARLHQAGLYHGEICPEHVLIHTDPSGKTEYKICGFGHYTKKPKSYYSSPSISPYLDPRVLEDPYQRYDSSCDIWSLGILAYKLVTGEFPDMEEKSLQGTPNEYLTITSDIPISTTLNHLISRCVVSEPRARIKAQNIPFHPFFIPIRTDTGDYTITDKELGSGKFGTVYLSHLKADPTQKFAAKVLKPLDGMDYRDRMLILGEISILMMIKHCPFVIKLFDYFEYNKKVHLILEYCDGGDLEYYLQKQQKMANSGEISMLEEIKAIAYNLAHAVYALHTQNIIHRDIKPKNLLVSLDKKTNKLASAKLSDFGTSRELVDESTMAETMVGTPRYMAPDVLEGRYSIKMDVWSYGVTLYLLAYGFLPNEYGGSHNVFSTKVVKYPPKPLYGLPDSFVDLIKRCLTFDADRRLSMGDVINHRYFASDPCVTVPKVPGCYVIDTGKPLVETATYVVRKVNYIPTKANFVVKITKGQLMASDKEQIARDVNGLIVLRDCPYIYKLYQSFRVGDSYYFVLDYTLGETVQDYIAAQPAKRINIETIKSFAFSVASAISDIYARGLPHVKISPVNVYLCPEDDDTSSKKVPKTKLASYSRLIQEIAVVRGDTSSEGDVYGFGEFLYFLLFGTTAGYGANSKIPTKTHLTPNEYQSACDLIRKCSDKIYTFPSQVLNDPFFTS